MTGCLRPKPADSLPILAGIQPAELRPNGATLSLARRAMEPGNLFHAELTRPSSALKSGHPFVPTPQQHLISSSDNNNRSAAQWTDHQWKAKWSDNPTRLLIFIPDTGTHLRNDLPRRAWVRLNRPRTGVRRFHSCLYKLGVASSATVVHVVLRCPIHRTPHGLHGLTVLDDDTIEWLLNIYPEIECSQAVV